MGAGQSKKQELKKINGEINSLRQSIRQSKGKMNPEGRDEIANHLAMQTQEIDSLRGKVKEKEILKSLRMVSDTTKELLSQETTDENSDSITVETNSIIQLPTTRKPVIKEARSKEKRKSNYNATYRRNADNLTDLEDKLKSLKPQIETAIKNEDRTQLRVHRETVKILATDLEMVTTNNITPLEDRKDKLQKDLSKCYQKIDKANIDLRRNSNISYLHNQSKNNAWGVLKNLEQKVLNIEENYRLNNKSTNLQTVLDKLEGYKKEIKAASDLDEHIKHRKGELLEIVEKLEHEINSKIAALSDLNQHEWKLENINKTIDTNKNKDFIPELLKLRDSLNQIASIDKDIEERKKKIDRDISNVMDEVNIIHNQTSGLVNGYSLPKEDNGESIIGFLDYWKNLEKHLDSGNASVEDMRKLNIISDNVRSFVRNSCRSLGNEVENNIVVRRNVRSNYEIGNNRDNRVSGITDQVDNPVIKTKARYYDVSPSLTSGNLLTQKQMNEIENVELNKITEQINNYKVFVEDIKLETNTHGLTQRIETKLNSIIPNLNIYATHKNQNISSLAVSVKVALEEILNQPRRLSVHNQNNERKISIENSFSRITNITSAVNEIEKNIINSNMRGHEKNDLLFYKQILDDIDISSKYGMIRQSKEETLHKINNLLQKLELIESENIKKIRKDLKEAKQKVYRFSGSYKNILYNEVEKNLNKILTDVLDETKDEVVVNEVVNEVEQSLKILEQRASKPEDLRRSSVSENLKREVNNIKTEVSNIFLEVNNPKPFSLNTYSDFDDRLRKATFKLDTLNVNRDSVIHTDVKQIYEQMRRCAEVIQMKKELSMADFTNGLPNKDEYLPLEANISEISDQFAEVLVEIKTKNPNFVGSQNKLSSLLLDLDNLNIRKGDKFYNESSLLYENINKCITYLKGRIDQIQIKKGLEEKNQVELKLLDIKNDFQQIVSEINAGTPHPLEEYPIFEGRLSVLILELDLLRNEPHSFVSDSIEQLHEEISRYVEWVQEKIKLNELLPEVHETPRDIDEKGSREFSKDVEYSNEFGNVEVLEPVEKSEIDVLIEIGEELEFIKKEIMIFVGYENSDKYNELDDILTRFTHKLDKYKFPRGDELYRKKLDLLENIDYLSDTLSQRAIETEDMRKIENEVEKICKRMQKLNGEKERKKVDEELIDLKVRVEKFVGNKELQTRKSQCMKKINDCLRKVNKSEVKENDFVGTLV